MMTWAPCPHGVRTRGKNDGMMAFRSTSGCNDNFALGIAPRQSAWPGHTGAALAAFSSRGDGSTGRVFFLWTTPI